MTSTITLISALFDFDLSATSDESIMPANAVGHVAGSEAHWAPTGLPSRKRNQRSWLTFWRDENSAEQFMDRRTDHIPLLARAGDVSVAVLQPFATHGDVNWIDTPAAPLDFSLAQRPEITAPVFIITSAGFGKIGAGAIAFGQGTHKVRNAIQDQEDVRFEGQILADDLRIDGVTLSLWNNQSAVMDFAYKNDPHKTAMGITDHEDVVRGSFTRCLVKSFNGVWQGEHFSI